MKFIKKLLSFIVILLIVLFVQRQAIGDIADSRDMPCDEKIYQALIGEQRTINLMGYGLTDNELNDIWSHVIYSNADLFFVADEYEYTLLGDTVLTVTPRYAVSGEALSTARQVYEDALLEIHSHYNPNWTDLQTALFFHDYLCMYFSYDESLTRYTAYELLTDYSGVCQAYTLAYAALLEAYGIPCDYVISREMNHAWNVVTIDGVRYNVDVTFDDPTADRRGRASHENFLVSDAALADDHSFTYAEGYGQCTDTRYDSGAVWEGVNSGFVPVGDDFYFIKSGGLYRWDGNEPQYIDTIFATWHTDRGDGSYWKGNHSTLWTLDDKVLYSKPKSIMSYEPSTGAFYVEYYHDGQDDIYGFSYINDELVLQLGHSPNEPGTLVTVPEGFDG